MSSEESANMFCNMYKKLVKRLLYNIYLLYNTVAIEIQK